MKLHPRTLPVQRAYADLRTLLLDFQDAHDLTDAEMLVGLQEACSRVARRVLRAERHPNDPGRKADEA